MLNIGAGDPIRGAVLAAGEGKRLRPLTAHLPKPLVPVGGRPLIEIGLDALAALSLARVGVNAWHLGDALPRHLSHRPEPLTVVHEETLQGTGGGVRGIAAALGGEETLVVLNGDALFDFPLAPYLAAHRASGAMGTLVLRPVPAGSPFARVGVDDEGRVHRIAEVSGPGDDGRPLTLGAFTGVQFLEPALLAAIPPEGPCDILRSAWKQRMAEGADLRAVFAPADCLWLDVGTPERYVQANLACLRGRLPAPAWPPPDAWDRRIHPDARIHPQAKLFGPCHVGAGAEVGARAVIGPGTDLGAGAQVAAGSRLESCVVWPGASAVGRLEAQVVLPPLS